MKKLIIILLIASCTKSSEVKPDYPIKFQSTAYSNGYTMKTKQSPLSVIYDFVALPSIAEGVDKDYYKCIIGNSDFSKIYVSQEIDVKATSIREVKGSVLVYMSRTGYPATIYYKLVREVDNKESETRSLNTLWDK
jgi:hypothetical protein